MPWTDAQWREALESATTHYRAMQTIIACVKARADEVRCTGHVASDKDPKRCGRCGIHIDELRPDDQEIG